MNRNHVSDTEDLGSSTQIQSLLENLRNHQVELELQQHELERTSRELEQSRRDFDQLRDNAPVAYLTHDADGFVFEANRRARWLLGLQPCQQNFDLFTLFSAKVAELFRFHISRAKSSPVPVSVEFPIDGIGNNKIFLLAETSKLGGSVFQTIMIDVSTRKESEKVREKLDSEVLHSQKMEVLDRISGGIAHDFNNILQVLVLQAEIARIKIEPTNEVALEAIRQIEETANRGVELTKRILAFSRKRPLEKIRIDLNEILGNSEELLNRSVGENWHVKFEKSKTRLGVWVDPVQIEQALLNLCLNAKDAMQNGGTIEISTERRFIETPTTKSRLPLMPGSYAVISVKDSGSGIPAETMARIFEPYFTTKPAGKGTGLGLPIVYSILKQHAGGIEVFRSDERGTQIDLYFYSFHLPETPKITQSEKRNRDDRIVGSVLICDDEPTILAALAESLENLGLSIHMAKDGNDAMQKINELDQVDLLLTDIVIPGYSGRQISEEFRNKFPDSAVVLMSGHGDSVLDEEFLRAINATFLPKPFRLDNLRDKLGLHLLSH